jgi:hypothetical protein
MKTDFPTGMQNETESLPSTPPPLSGKASLFLGTQSLILGLLIATFFVFLRRQKSPESRFKVREADRPKKPFAKSKKETHSGSSNQREQAALPGFRIDGEPHEILGVAIDANPKEIQRAFRELMKRYHPDHVGRPGTREWKDAQKFAEALIRAKEAMTKKQN